MARFCDRNRQLIISIMILMMIKTYCTEWLITCRGNKDAVIDLNHSVAVFHFCTPTNPDQVYQRLSREGTARLTPGQVKDD